jgi:hypothetical protein
MIGVAGMVHAGRLVVTNLDRYMEFVWTLKHRQIGKGGVLIDPEVIDCREGLAICRKAREPS